MFPGNQHSSKRPLRLAALAGCAWLCAALASCAEAAPADTDRLSSLSTGQLRALCSELPSAWGEQDTPLACENGRSLYFDQAGLAACGSDETTCTASVGEWRACMLAVAADECQAAEQEPAECAVLRSAPGCGGVVLPLLSRCTPPTAEHVAALDGVYQLVSNTRNDASCAAEGAPLPASGYLALAATHFPGALLPRREETPMLILQDCTSVEACQQRMAELLSASEPLYALDAGPMNAELPDAFVCGPDRSGALLASSQTLSAGEQCAVTTQETALSTDSYGLLRIEVERFLLPQLEGERCSVPLDSQKGDCVSLQVLRAQLVAPL